MAILLKDIPQISKIFHIKQRIAEYAKTSNHLECFEPTIRYLLT